MVAASVSGAAYCAAAHASMSRRVSRPSAGIHRPLVERRAGLHSHDGILRGGEGERRVDDLLGFPAAERSAGGNLADAAGSVK
jgi:hypothetical protein